MASVTVYVPDDLDRRAREAHIPLSRAFQAVLESVLDHLAEGWHHDAAENVVAVMAERGLLPSPDQSD